jgi:hypothetical protein
MALTKAKVSFVEGVDGAQLTGAMPAVDGAALTGIAGMTKTTSDPLITSNPATGVGTVWLNKSTSELFGCTDATTGANVWVNIGGGYGGYGKSFGGRGPGTVAGYTAGGYLAGTDPHKDTIDKFSIPNPSGTATDHANLTNGVTAATSCCSATDGYVIGGQVRGYGTNPPDNIRWTKIQKYNFATANTVSQPGDITVGCLGSGGHSSATSGYISSGLGISGGISRIEKFSFSDESSSVNVGNIANPARRLSNCGHSSNTHGFSSTGESPTANHIDKFSFESLGNGVDHGDLTVARYSSAGISSETHGYVAGGNGPLTNTLDRFSFSSSVGASDVGDLTENRASSAGVSGSTKGYVSGAYQGTQGRIEEFAYASSVNATNVATLFEARGYSTGTQY